MTGDRAILTLAVGKPIFAKVAATLERSVRYWNAGNGIRFVIATDMPDELPADVREHAEVLVLRPGQYGEGFSPKLHLDEMAPAARTLFVDADCLCVGGLASVFDRFAGCPVGVVAGRIERGEWFGDVSAICQAMTLPALPKFNGGIYYIESGSRASSVFATARALEPRYDELGLVRLRGRPNDELLMAIALAVHGLWGIPEDGSIMAEPLNFGCGLEVDVLAGQAALYNTPGHPSFNAQWPLHVGRPLLVHFLGYHIDRVPYTAEALKLEKVLGAGWTASAARLYANATRTLPSRMVTRTKDALRPAYHRIFGTREVAPSSRG